MALSSSEEDLDLLAFLDECLFVLDGLEGLSVLTTPALMMRPETDETASLENGLGLALSTELIAAS